MVANAKEEQLSSFVDLPFVSERLALLRDPGHSPLAQKHLQDRTTQLVGRWQRLNKELLEARKETLSCLEARPSKGDSVTFAVVDKERFDSLQHDISSHREQIAALEEAARKLDAMGGLWLADFEASLNTSGLTEPRMRQRIASLTAEYSLRNPNMSTEEVLKIPDYLENVKLCEREIASSGSFIEKNKPILHEARAILEAVDC